jgi:2-keto-4-pentenoate hydratase/2-oxohepta-3-ene-1,7-dioic acid hydratase in catechol pathway
MRLVTFKAGPANLRAAVIVSGRVVDAQQATAALLRVDCPGTVRSILNAGPAGLDSVAKLAEHAAKYLDKEGGAPWAAPLAAATLAPPVPDPQKIVCIGLNYKDHCAEQNVPVPKSPVIFSKFNTSLAGPRDPIVLPKISQQIDPEVELAFVIGKAGRNIPEKSALEHVAGYMTFNDLSARDIQYSDKQWVRAKSFDTFAPCGPALVTRDEIPDPQSLKLELSVNGEVRQSSNTNQMIFGVAYLISFLSRSFTWMPGDIVATGTPPGVGVFRKPPVFLKPGDKVVASVERLGSLENTCMAE